MLPFLYINETHWEKTVEEVCQMKVNITKSAAEELNKKIGDQKGYLKIQYVTDRLAFGAGVPTLLFISSKDETEDILFETSDRSVILEKSQMIYFNDDLTNDYSDSVNSFQLRSPQQFIKSFVLNFVCCMTEKS